MTRKKKTEELRKDKYREPKELPDPEDVKELTDNGRFVKVPWMLLRVGYMHVCHLLSPYENILWWFIMMKTAGFHKETDWISHSQIVKGTSIPKSKISEVKKKLLGKHMIVVDGKKVGIETNFAKWILPISRGTAKGWYGRIKIWKTVEVDENGEEKGTIWSRNILWRPK